VLPGVYQAGFFYSVHGGNGVLIARRDDGGWGSPVFVNLAGAGYGLQAGLEKSRLVLAVLEEEMLERILSCGLNLDASAKYDILGVREETGPSTLTEERPVMAFADGVGLMAGIAIRGGVLTVNKGLTRAYHGVPADGIETTMRGISAPGLETFDLWAALGVVPETPSAGGILRADTP
jgi:lipid-binding SYLF domain-containing protein